MLKLAQLLRFGEALGERCPPKKLLSNEWALPLMAQSTDASPLISVSVRFARYKTHLLEIPKAGTGYFRRTVHYPEKYTIKPIPYTNLAGRDPVSGDIPIQ